MLIEVSTAITVHWRGRDQVFTPGHRYELSAGEGRRLLAKMGDRVRLVMTPIHLGDQITWPRADGTTQTGLIDDLHTDADGTHWGFVIMGEDWAAVNLKYATRVDRSRE